MYGISHLNVEKKKTKLWPIRQRICKTIYYLYDYFHMRLLTIREIKNEFNEVNILFCCKNELINKTVNRNTLKEWSFCNVISTG